VQTSWARWLAQSRSPGCTTRWRNTDYWRAVLGAIILGLVLPVSHGHCRLIKQVGAAALGRGGAHEPPSKSPAARVVRWCAGDGVSFELASGELLVIGRMARASPPPSICSTVSYGPTRESVHSAGGTSSAPRARSAAWATDRQTFCPLTVVENVQMALLSADRQVVLAQGGRPPATRWRCWNKWACNRPRSAPAAYWPMGCEAG
jgi:hypothetical protein